MDYLGIIIEVIGSKQDVSVKGLWVLIKRLMTILPSYDYPYTKSY